MKELIFQIVNIWRSIANLQKAFYVSIILLIIGCIYFSTNKRSEEAPLPPQVVKNEKKGFELFDSKTWIKGENELQILEMRALKGQLEKEISTFENIQDAHIIIDFGDSGNTKASVILDLKKEKTLSPSVIKAISYHLAGGIKGLELNNIAISDTTGKIYQVFGNQSLWISKSQIEEELKGKIQSFLTPVLGDGNFEIALNVLTEKKKLFIALLFNKNGTHLTPFSEIEKQIKVLAQGYELDLELSSEILPFFQINEKEKDQKQFSFFKLFAGSMVFLTVICGALYLTKFLPYKKVKQKDEIVKMMNKINLKTLSTLIVEQPPSTIAMMLSYLEKERAEKLLNELPLDLQKEVQSFL